MDASFVATMVGFAVFFLVVICGVVYLRSHGQKDAANRH